MRFRRKAPLMARALLARCSAASSVHPGGRAAAMRAAVAVLPGRNPRSRRSSCPGLRRRTWAAGRSITRRLRCTGGRSGTSGIRPATRSVAGRPSTNPASSGPASRALDASTDPGSRRPSSRRPPPPPRPTRSVARIWKVSGPRGPVRQKLPSSTGRIHTASRRGSSARSPASGRGPKGAFTVYSAPVPTPWANPSKLATAARLARRMARNTDTPRDTASTARKARPASRRRGRHTRRAWRPVTSRGPGCGRPSCAPPGGTWKPRRPSASP